MKIMVDGEERYLEDTEERHAMLMEAALELLAVRRDLNDLYGAQKHLRKEEIKLARLLLDLGVPEYFAVEVDGAFELVHLDIEEGDVTSVFPIAVLKS